MADRTEEPSGEVPLSERALDLLVFVPAGIVASLVEEIPKLAERGRSLLGVRVSLGAGGRRVRVQSRPPGAPPPLGRIAPEGCRPGASAGRPPGGALSDTHDSPESTTTEPVPDRCGPAGRACAGPRSVGRPGPRHTHRHRQRACPGGRLPGHPGVRHAVRLPGRPAARRPHPHRAGLGPCVRDRHPSPAHDPQPGRPAARRAVLSPSAGVRRGGSPWSRSGRPPPPTLDASSSWPRSSRRRWRPAGEPRLLRPDDAGVTDPLDGTAVVTALLADPERTALVGSLDEWIAGLAVLRIAGGPGDERRGVIDSCYVEPGARGVGLGHLLLEQALEWFAARTGDRGRWNRPPRRPRGQELLRVSRVQGPVAGDAPPVGLIVPGAPDASLRLRI